jgi:hypothetical protein
MYDTLSTTELTTLQDMLYTATEKVYRMANLAPADRDWLSRYRPVHAEIARLFLEAGQELLNRLDNPHEMTAA